MLSVAEARARVLSLVRPMAGEPVALTEAAGRVLAAPARAARAQPPFAASAMDGYAVRAAEAAAGARLRLAGEAAAGHASADALPPGAAMRIFTGAPVPAGADSILIQEDARAAEGAVEVVTPPDPGAYIRPAGGDFPAGHALAAPRRLGPSEIALLAAMNCAEVTVARRPVVALIPTGDELVLPGETPAADQIVASNNFGLAALLARAGAEPRLCPIARDNRASLLAALEAAKGADMVVTLGGASVGDHDLVAAVFGDAGLSLDFYKIAMRPGKPLMAGRIGPMAMLGLPGNPVSALVCGHLFVVPAVERALGLDGAPPVPRPARLAADEPANGPREHYMRARLDWATEGLPLAHVAENQDSSLLSVLADADALVIRAPRAPAAPAGSLVEYLPLT
ncbi:MAG: gephyrin-like molybdotransferase Glp [Pseudomonadota bacterium]